MKIEDKYKAQLQELGIWQEAFAPEIHTLAMMERELRREQTEWRKASADLKARSEDGKIEKDLATLLKAVDAHYSLILTLRRDILAHRDALGLTPKGLQRLRGKDAPVADGSPAPSAKQISDAFSALQARCQSYDA